MCFAALQNGRSHFEVPTPLYCHLLTWDTQKTVFPILEPRRGEARSRPETLPDPGAHFLRPFRHFEQLYRLAFRPAPVFKFSCHTAGVWPRRLKNGARADAGGPRAVFSARRCGLLKTQSVRAIRGVCGHEGVAYF
jgi:hypothetical protein